MKRLPAWLALAVLLIIVLYVAIFAENSPVRPKPKSHYTVIIMSTPTQLEEQVNEFIELGYKPCGGIALVPGTPGGYGQAMYTEIKPYPGR